MFPYCVRKSIWHGYSFSHGKCCKYLYCLMTLLVCTEVTPPLRCTRRKNPVTNYSTNPPDPRAYPYVRPFIFPSVLSSVSLTVDRSIEWVTGLKKKKKMWLIHLSTYSCLFISPCIFLSFNKPRESCCFCGCCCCWFCEGGGSGFLISVLFFSFFLAGRGRGYKMLQRQAF